MRKPNTDNRQAVEGLVERMNGLLKDLAEQREWLIREKIKTVRVDNAAEAISEAVAELSRLSLANEQLSSDLAAARAAVENAERDQVALELATDCFLHVFLKCRAENGWINAGALTSCGAVSEALIALRDSGLLSDEEIYLANFDAALKSGESPANAPTPAGWK